MKLSTVRKLYILACFVLLADEKGSSIKIKMGKMNGCATVIFLENFYKHKSYFRSMNYHSLMNWNWGMLKRVNINLVHHKSNNWWINNWNQQQRLIFMIFCLLVYISDPMDTAAPGGPPSWPSGIESTTHSHLKKEVKKVSCTPIHHAPSIYSIWPSIDIATVKHLIL